MKIERMSKEDFINNLQEIEQDVEFYDAICSIRRKYNRDDEINILPNSISIAIKLLEVAIGDKYEYVSWWCWEKDWGKRGKDFAVYDINGKLIPSETPEDIYNIVTKNIMEDI